MKATELRIGNWTFDLTVGDAPYQILDGDTIDHAEEFLPIPLTEEWLDKFGFEVMLEQTGSKMFRLHRPLPCVYKIHEYKYEWDKRLGYYLMYNDIATPTKIEYVHQLQNIFFYLTESELTIKP